MSAPALVACAAAALCVAVPVLGGAAHAGAARLSAGTADAAALAAADALLGYISAEPCEIASRVAAANHASLRSCVVDESALAVRVEVGVAAPFGEAHSHAHAGPSP